MTDQEIYRCGASIDGPKVGYRVVAWRKQCRIRVNERGEHCRFHGKPCPYCGKKMYDTLGWSHALNCSERKVTGG